MLPFFSYVWIIICRSDGQFVGHMKYFSLQMGEKKRTPVSKTSVRRTELYN
jgi:hypothetical protein